MFPSAPVFLYNMRVRFRILLVAIACLFLAGVCLAQEDEGPVERVPIQKNAPPPKDNRTQPPRSDQLAPDESSSKETQIDVSPPSGDAKRHPEADLDTDSGDTEFHPFDPHRAMKDIEVGDYYFKRENYVGAIGRYRDALEYKPRDAEATYKLAEALEKTANYREALSNYREYLKILPKGPYAEKAQQGIDRLKDKVSTASQPPSPSPATPQ